MGALRQEVKRLAQVGRDKDAEIARLQSQLAEWQASQTYRYIGRDGKAVLARELEDRAERAEAKLAAMTAERDAALNAVIKLGDRLQRECFGLNNEGDPIGGDPPAGWKPRAEKAEAQLAEEKALSDRIAASYAMSLNDKAKVKACPSLAAYRKARGLW